jgi:hypothetical protein
MAAAFERLGSALIVKQFKHINGIHIEKMRDGFGT